MMVKALEELVTDRRFNQDAGAREADLARVIELPSRLLGRGVEVGVGEDDAGGPCLQAQR